MRQIVPSWKQSRRIRRWSAALFVAVWLSAAGSGCSLRSTTPPSSPTTLMPSRIEKTTARRLPTASLRQVSHTPPATTEVHPPAVKVVPITLDTILRLTPQQNLQIQLAREKVNDSYTNLELAKLAWLPDLSVALQYRRHDGGIQDPDGTLLNSHFNALFGGVVVQGQYDIRENVFRQVQAERTMWERRGEWRDKTATKLLDATQTYVDLLAARSAELISSDIESKLQELVDKAKALAKIEPGFQVETKRTGAQLTAQKRVTEQLRKNANVASANLVHLLELKPCVALMPVDPQLVPLHLVPLELGVCKLTELAVNQGPGVHEIQGLLALVHSMDSQSQRGSFFPIIEGRAYGGGLGAGPGSRMDWEDTWDLKLQARWQIKSNAVHQLTQQRRWSQKAQVHLQYDHVRSHLALGVRSAFEECISRQRELDMLQNQLDAAAETFRLSKKRYISLVKGGSASEVLLSLGGLASAQFDYINTIRDYNKAQLRLFIFTGGGCVPPTGPGPAPKIAAGVTLQPAEVPDGEQAPPLELLPAPEEEVPPNLPPEGRQRELDHALYLRSVLYGPHEPVIQVPGKSLDPHP